MKKYSTIIIAVILMISLSACSTGQGSTSEKLSDSLNIKAKTQEELKAELDKIQLSEKEHLALTDFSINVLKHAVKQNGNKKQNTLISGMSILPCLGMVQNGAAENTLKQMENTLGFDKNILNKYLYEYRVKLEGEEEQKLLMANSIWFKKDDKIEVIPEFLQINTDFYNAEIYKKPFDKNTADEINAWVKNKTNNKIDQIVGELDNNAIMYLINAIYFADTWDKEYRTQNVQNAEFTLEDASKKEVELMYSSEDIYLEDENTIGVKKNYKDGKYSFIALLPNKKITIEEYLKDFNADKFYKMLDTRKVYEVHSYIPKFKTQYNIILNDIFINMGMEDAFNGDMADFSKMAISKNPDENILISNVIHKTYIEVDEKGTKAAAVTAVEMNKCEQAEEEKAIIKSVRLDRPFIYMIYDNKNNIPVFIGSMMKPE